MKYWKETSITTAIILQPIKVKNEDGDVITLQPGETALLTGDYKENEEDECCFAFGKMLNYLIKISEAESAPDKIHIGLTHGIAVDTFKSDILPNEYHVN